jgi:hypothetical protein
MKWKNWSLIIGWLAFFVIVVLALAMTRPERTAAGQGPPDDASLVPVDTAFTYQGYLEDGGNPANGLYDFQFKLFDALVGGSQVGSTFLVHDLSVADGLFGAALDFGNAAFGGGARWLEIGVRPGASAAGYILLTPRQELTPTPHALAMPNVYANESINFVGIGRDFRISGNEVFGVRHDGSANDYGGMYVETSHANGWPFYGYATNGSFRAWSYYNGTNSDWYLYNAGIRLKVPNEGGLRIGPSADYSLVISNTTGSDGLRIYDTGDDAIQVGSDPDYSNYGLYIPSPGVSTYGLWPNTAEAAGEWALFTVDKIEASNVLLSGLMLVAKVTGSEALTTGDVVAAAGIADPLPGSLQPLPLVSLAQGSEAGSIGVVSSRMVWEVAPGKEAEGEMSLHSVDGPAQPGDYVSLVVFGVADVKVDPQATIIAGERLTVADLPGRVRTLETRMLDGMVISEGAQVIGIALTVPIDGQETISVFVTTQ